MALVKCPHCNKEVEENKFCPECGKILIVKKKKKLSKFAKRNIIFFSVLLVIIGAIVTTSYFYISEKNKNEIFYNSEGLTIGEVKKHLNALTKKAESAVKETPSSDQSQNYLIPINSGIEYENVKSILAPLDFDLQSNKEKTSYSIDIRRKESDPSFFEKKMEELMTSKKGIRSIDCSLLSMTYWENSGVRYDLAFIVMLSKQEGKYKLMGDGTNNIILKTTNSEAEKPLYNMFKYFLDNQ